MKDDSAIYISLALAGVLFFALSKTGNSIINDVEDAVSKLPSGARGIRNNNPGNIRKSNISWQGLSDTQTDPAFLQFDSMEYGVRAIAKILITYQDTYKLVSVRDIISRWAPATENDTQSYVVNVSSDVGVLPDDIINVHDQQTMFALIRAIISHENGGLAASVISDDAVLSGIGLAYNS